MLLLSTPIVLKYYYYRPSLYSNAIIISSDHRPHCIPMILFSNLLHSNIIIDLTVLHCYYYLPHCTPMLLLSTSLYSNDIIIDLTVLQCYYYHRPHYTPMILLSTTLYCIAIIIIDLSILQ